MKKYLIFGSVIFLVLIFSGYFLLKNSQKTFENESEQLKNQVNYLQQQVNDLKQSATVTEQQAVVQTNESAVPEISSGWKEYRNDCFSFKYPADWSLLVDDKCSGVYIGKNGSGLNNDSIQFIKDEYSKVSSLENDQYKKIVNESFTSYYYLNTTPGGPQPTIYLAKDGNLILASYNIFTSSTTEAESILKNITATFKFIK